MPDQRQRDNRRPRTNVAVPNATNRVPKKASDLIQGEDIDLAHSHPCWNFQHLDTTHSGSWDWDLDANEQAQFFGFLKEMQRLTWEEIGRLTYNGAGNYRKQLHHAMPTETICAEAKNRLSDIGLGELETAFRFRLGTSIRVWGAFVGFGHEFHVVWWDRDHQVYPLD